MSREQEIRERAEMATPGPWRAYETALINENAKCEPEPLGLVWPGSPEDAEFIAHAREDIPYLLDELAKNAGEVERLKGENEATKDLVGAARIVCQWLDMHEEDIAGWEDGAKLCIAAMHRRVVEYEELGESAGGGGAG